MSEWMRQLPSNVVLNKGVTGCGATTVAIEQDRPTIMAVPFTGLIGNKAKQKPHILGIYGEGDKTAEIKSHLESSKGRIKIMTTYDSLPKVCRTLQALGYDVYKEAQLVVDEWHQLLNSYGFRSEAIRGVWKEAGLFADKVFLSATPLERKYWPKELSNHREYRIQWPNALPVSVRSHWNGKPVDYMAALCRQLLDSQQEDMKQYNYHIFLNSVADISRIIKKARLSQADVRIVCSQSGLSKRRNEAKLEGFPIATTADPVKRINLYTSTAFEGQDIFDEHGIAFVVSDSHKEHTLVDISTELIQIAGRIRDSKRKNQIVHFYNTKPYPAVSADEFEQAMRRQMAEAKRDAAWLNRLSDSCKAGMKQSMVNEYIRFEGGKFLVDENRFNFEMMNYKVVNGIYLTKASMEAELGKNGISITDNQVCPTVSIDTPNGTGRSFKDLFEAYAQAVATRPKIAIEPTAEMIVIEVQDGLVKEAYEKLGVDEVRRMKYHKANIQRAVTAKGDAKTDVKIMELLKQSGIRQGFRYQKNQVKDAIQAAYDTLGLKRKAKSTDLKQWYEVKEESPKIDGKSTACMTITSPKVMRVTNL